MDPRFKIVCVVILMATASVLRSCLLLLACLALALLLLKYSRLPRRWVIQRLAQFGWLLAFFALPLVLLTRSAEPWWVWGPVNVSVEGLLASAQLCLRALSILLFALVLFASTPIDALSKAARALYVPGLVVQLLLLTIRYLVLVTEEFRRLKVALWVRGFRNRSSLHAWRTVGQVTGSLLVRSHDRAERVAAAMRCRGFDGNFRCLTDFQARSKDGWALALTLASALILLVLDFFVLVPLV